MNTNKNTKPVNTKPVDKADEIIKLADTPAAVLNLQLSNVTAEQVAASRYAAFKNTELAKACVLVDGVLAKGGALVVEKARIYGRVLSAELWKDDGFSNFKEFASKTFGDKPGTAYAMAKAGYTYYSANPGTTEAKLAVNTWSILDKFSKLSHEDLEKLDADKRFPADYRLTQTQAEDLAKEVLAKKGKEGKDGAEKVVQTFDFKGMIYKAPYVKTGADGADSLVPAVAEPFKEEDCVYIADAILLTDYVTKDFKVGDSAFTVAADSVGNIQVLWKSKHVKAEPVKLDPTSYNRIKKGYDKGMSAEDVHDLTDLPMEKVKAVFADLDKLKANGKEEGKGD